MGVDRDVQPPGGRHVDALRRRVPIPQGRGARENEPATVTAANR
jgi:hypothetical protein